jgi:hypothetical protein
MATYSLLPAQNGTRVKIESVGIDPIQIVVGEGGPWVAGNYIEVVRNTSTAEVYLTAFPGVQLNLLTGFRNNLYLGEHARVTYLGGDVWDFEIFGVALEVDGFTASSGTGGMVPTLHPGITHLNFDEGFSLVEGITPDVMIVEAGQVAVFLISTSGVMNQNNNLLVENVDTSTKEAPAIVTVSTGGDGRSVFNLQKAGWYRVTANLRLNRSAGGTWYDQLVHFGTTTDAQVIGPSATRHSSGYTPTIDPAYDFLAGFNYSPTGQNFRSISDQYIVRVTDYSFPAAITIGAYVAANITSENFDIYGTLVIERLNGAVPKVSF